MSVSKPLALLTGATKFYNSRLIFKNSELTLHPEELTLIIGDNGVGKSTLLRILAGLTTLDKGKCQIDQNIIIGYLGHGTFVYPELTAGENLLFWGKVFKLKHDSSQIEYILEKVGLVDRKNDQAKFFSRGMTQRLNFARILLLKPQLLLLDEPFTGLDVKFRNKIMQEIMALKKEGSAIALVSHSRDEDLKIAEKVCEIVNKKFTVTPIATQLFTNTLAKE